MKNQELDPVEEVRDATPAGEGHGSRPVRVTVTGRGSAAARWGDRLLEFALLAAIVLAAIVLRFRGIEWGTGYYLHPDEQHLTDVLTRISAPSSIQEYLDSAASPLNPFNNGTGFIYGTFPLFVAKIVASFTEYSDISNGHIPGRWVSAVADTGTVVLVWWIGRMLWNRGTGLLAALLMAFTVLHIGASHYFTTDTASAFFATATFAFTVAAVRYRRWVFYALAGLMVGLAVASKPTMLAAVGFLALPALETVRRDGWRALWPRWSQLGDREDRRAFPVLLASALALFVAVWTIRVAQPYIFEGSSLFSFRFDPRWVADLEFWRGVQAGEIDYPPSIQWSERTPILFQLDHLIRWGMGPGLGIAALGGLAWQLWRMAVGRVWPSWITLGLVGWIGFHLLYFGVALSKVQRYLMPAYPFLVLLAAAAIVATARWGWRRGILRVPFTNWRVRFPRWLHPGTILPLVAVVTTVFYGAAFVSVYSEPHTRVEASGWIGANVPDGATIAWEYWDLPLPVGVPAVADRSYTLAQIEPYGDENGQKLTHMIATLQRSDYIVLSSARLSDTIPRMPWRYPMATRYYEALDSGELGFDEVAHFTSYPELFGIEIDDRSAEESLTVYDHPEVTIFQKTDRWNAHDAWYLLENALGHGGLSILPVQTQPDRMMLDPGEQASVRSQPAWSSIFDPGSVTNRLPVVFWYLALQLLAVPLVPILWRLCPWLPDRGYTLAKTIGVFAVGWVAWWLATLRLLDFGLAVIAAAWLALLVVGAVIVRAQAGRLAADFRGAWRWLFATEMLLLGGYLVALWARSHHPDLWAPGRIGGQLQDMAMFNAMALTPIIPAYDPWLADGSIHDFTFGYVPWAVMTRLTGIVPEAAFSLTLATLVALVIVNAWLAAAVVIHRFRPSPRAWGAIAGGLLAPVLLVGVGSWDMAQRVGSGDWGLNFEGTAVDAVDGLWTTITSNPGIPPGAWHTSGVVVDSVTLEFPLLSFLTGEMGIQHLALPLLPLGAVPLFGFLTRERSGEPTGFQVMASLGGWRTAAPFIAGSGLVTGWTFAANPLFGLALTALATLAVFFAVGSFRFWTGAWIILRDSALAGGSIGAVACLAVAPFILSYGTFATRRAPVLQPLAVNEYIGYLGVLIAVAVGYLLWQLWSLGGSMREIEGIGWAGVIGCGVLVLAALGLAVAVGHLAIFLLLVLLLLGCLVWHRHDDVRHLMLLATLTLVAVFGIVANRMTFETWSPRQNIPVQLSLASWMLLAIVAAPVVALALATAWDRASWPRMARKRLVAVGSVATLGVLIGASAVYPVLGYPNRLDDRLVQASPTLDSFVFMNEGQLDLNAANSPVDPYDLDGDLAAIRWMRANLAGLPTILEAPSLVNGWGGRVSALTGYPTVIGVVPVQKQQRPGMERLIDWRYADVTEVYGSEAGFSEIEPILQDYGVRVIYVGALERATYPAAALAKFDEAVGAGDLDVLYEADGVTLYAYRGAREAQAPYDP
ncbi:MAG: glycosyltransferase family 39 protein [Chloroflexia bacterium]|nr:glycosyltransferase family 39 protein [Chloroflexia bacterium]